MTLATIIALLLALLLATGVRTLDKIYQIPAEKHKDLSNLSKIPCQAVTITLGDGQSLKTWYFPAKKPAPAIIAVHGLGDSARRLYPLVKPFRQLGLAVLLVNARFHGESKGKGQVSIRQFSEDIKSAVDWLLKETQAKGNDILLLGHSLGAASALLAASEDPRIKGVISVSSFAHSATQLRRQLSLARIPYWPLGWFLIWYKQKRQGFSFERVAPRNTIGEIRVPVLLVHAKDDGTVPLSDAITIYNNRHDDRTQLLVLDKGMHYPMLVLRNNPESLSRFYENCL